MSESLSTHLNRVLLTCGFPAESAYAAATTTSGKQIFELANISARALREGDFQECVLTGTVAMTTSTDYALPTGFLSIVPDTMRVENSMEPLDFPATVSRWADIKYAGGPTALPIDARIIGNRLHVANPRNGTNLKFEYISSYPITDSTGVTPKIVFTADTDLWVLDDQMFFLDVRWRFKKEKGIADWNADLQEFIVQTRNVRGRNRGSRTLVPAPAEYHAPEPYTNLWIS